MSIRPLAAPPLAPKDLAEIEGHEIATELLARMNARSTELLAKS